MRLWLDLTGIAPGSDAAVLARSLWGGLVPHCDTRFCVRRPGLAALDAAEATALLAARPPDGRLAAAASRLRGAADRLPPRARQAVGRFVRQQSAAITAWRDLARRPAGPTAAPLADTLALAPGDWLIGLAPSLDAGRLRRDGVRLAVILADLLPLCRPDRAGLAASGAAEVWRRATLPYLDVAIALSTAGAAALTASGWLGDVVVVPAAPCLATTRRTPGGHVLAMGEIGRGGHTHMLLHAWRLLFDAPSAEPAPTLVLAGPLGVLSADIVAQLRNSRDFDGSVRLVADPTEAIFAGWLETARFSVAMAPHDAWDRPRIESRAAGIACLSAAAGDFDPDDANSLAWSLRRWLAAPPQTAPAEVRDWDAVAQDVLRALRP